MGRKVSDKFTVPICRLHHRELHWHGDERVWWSAQGIEPLIIAANLWSKTISVAPTGANISGPWPTTVNTNGSHLGLGSQQEAA